VIVEQANRNLINLPLILRARLGRGRIAYWGQGRNVFTTEHTLSERLKAGMLGLVDWWFAYTRGVASYLTSHGVRPDTVTVVQNATDTRQLRRQLDGVTAAQLGELRLGLGIAAGDPVGLFCGSLSPGKRVDFLIDAARRVRAAVPGFHLLVVGAGPAERELAAMADAPWIHFLGRQTGSTKATAFRLADVFVMPAWVGLSVLDAFAAGLPVLTTDLPGHSVEVEYIEHAHNGLVAAPAIAPYADAVITVLGDAVLRARLARGARAAGDRYSIERMVANFHGGIRSCLDGVAHQRSERARP
jgi:glycosyltransferase involved in cell wall biosynthesis